MFGSRHQPFNFAQYYASQSNFMAGNDVLPDPATSSWHSTSSLPYSSCARSGSYDDWSSVPMGQSQQPSSPTCSHASSPGAQPLGYGYHHSSHHQGYRLTPPTSADYTSANTATCTGPVGHGSHFLFPDMPPPQVPPQQACSPDSGVALGSDGGVVSGSESPSCCGGGSLQSSHGVHPALQQAGIMAGCFATSRPQPARSPYEWIKKPSYQITIQPGKTRTKDKYRVVYTDHQRLELEKEFHYSRYITIRRKSELAQGLGLSERQVKIWFQNRRAKERKQMKKKEEIARREFGNDLGSLKLEPDSIVLCHPANVLSPSTCTA